MIAYLLNFFETKRSSLKEGPTSPWFLSTCFFLANLKIDSFCSLKSCFFSWSFLEFFFFLTIYFLDWVFDISLDNVKEMIFFLISQANTAVEKLVAPWLWFRLFEVANLRDPICLTLKTLKFRYLMKKICQFNIVIYLSI